MRTRSSHGRMLELTRWLNKNKKANWREFVRETGGTQTQYYHVRSNLGIAKKNPVLSEAMKVATKRRYSKIKEDPVQVGLVHLDKIKEETNPDIVTKIQKENEEYLAGPSTPKKEEVVVEGITPDFIWYEMDLMQRRLGDVSSRLNHVMRVSQSRDGDQKKMMRELINENTTLRVENGNLKQQVIELTEMINGTPV